MKNKFIRIAKYLLQLGKYLIQGFLLIFVLSPLFFLDKKITSRLIFQGNLFETIKNIFLFIKDISLFMKKAFLTEIGTLLFFLPGILILFGPIFGFLIYTSDKIIKEVFIKNSGKKISIQVILRRVGLFLLKYILASIFSFSLIIAGLTLINEFDWAKKFDLFLFIPILILLHYFINWILSLLRKKRKSLNNS